MEEAKQIFRFANTELLYLFFLIPVLIVVFIIAWQIKKKALKKFGDLGVISQLMPEVSFNRPIAKFILFAIAGFFLIIAIAQPQFGAKLEEVKRQGVEIMIALDVSNSMLAEDISPNRLEKAKLAISKMVEKLQNDKIGLIVFAGNAYMQVPITTDYSAAKMLLSGINTDIVPTQGTSISSAIELASKSFSPKADCGKAIIIITDGENHEPDAVNVAQQAAEKGIVVYTIGMGTPKGVPIPVKKRFGSKGYRKDKDGNIVVSKLDEKSLQEIASAANGAYIRANNTKIGLMALYKEISKLQKGEVESSVFSDYDDKFQYFIGFALFFLLLDLLMLERKNKLLKNWKLF